MNSITEIEMTNGCTTSDQALIRDDAIKDFRDLLNSNFKPFSYKLTEHEVRFDFSLHELQQVVFTANPKKAPVVDGFYAKFSQVAWLLRLALRKIRKLLSTPAPLSLGLVTLHL